MELDRKAFHFDLDNKSVERFYTGKKNPWSDIQEPPKDLNRAH